MLLTSVRILVRMKYEPGLLNKFDRLRLYQLPLEVWWILLVDLRLRKIRKGCSGILFALALSSLGYIFHLYIAPLWRKSISSHLFLLHKL
jgi:hypothetical protein